VRGPLGETPGAVNDGGDPRAHTVFIFTWGNNPRRAELKGRRCVIEASGRMNTVLVRFLDTGERVTTSRRALKEDRQLTIW